MSAESNRLRPPVLAICPDCAALGRCRLGIPANYQLPPRGEKCKYTGKSRAYWEQRIYPHAMNHHQPPIQLGRPGVGRGKPVIPGDVICAYLRSGSPADYEI